MKEAPRGRAKTKNKTNFGKPDFSLTKYSVPVVIENKLGIKKLLASSKTESVKFDEKSVAGYAVNGALHYATGMVASAKYKEVIAIGIAGDSAENIELKVYYVFGSGRTSFKLLENVHTLDFLENEVAFEEFYRNATLTDEEKHEILITSREALIKQAKSLNKLMHNLSITAPQRVLYVSGMLLSMQPITDQEGNKIADGLVPDDLCGAKTNSSRDGMKVYTQISEFLMAKEIHPEKKTLMLSSFAEISKDKQRDDVRELEKEVSKFLMQDASTNKQIFTFIYENIFLSIDAAAGHLDIMGEMYSEFLKYALGDGKEIGIVLTPPYVTSMMAKILNVTPDSKVMDLATGSAGFLISAMEIMISKTEKEFGKNTSKANAKIEKIKKEQLLGVELDAHMYTLASTNMILRGDGSSKIQKGSAFNRPEKLFTDFKPNRLLLNPPFTYEEKGMPFIAYGLDKMEKGGLGAIIIQDSAGSGQAVETNKKILKKHTLLMSIKMPADLFLPMAGVQTSIYVFQAKKPHDKVVSFKNGIELNRQRAEFIITAMKKSFSFFSWGRSYDVSVLEAEKISLPMKKGEVALDFMEKFVEILEAERLESLDTYLASTDLKDYNLTTEEQKALDDFENVSWKEFRVGELFTVTSSKKKFNALDVAFGGKYRYIARGESNNGIKGYISEDERYLNKGNTFSFGQDTATVFYQDEPYFTGDKIKVFHPKKGVQLNRAIAQMFISSFQKSLSFLSWV